MGGDEQASRLGYADEIDRLRVYLIARGYRPRDCVDWFTRGRDNETLVVHFSKEIRVLPGDEKLTIFDTPDTIVAMLNLQTGKISIPDLF